MQFSVKASAVVVRVAFLRFMVGNAPGRKPWSRFQAWHREMRVGGSSRTSVRARDRQMREGELSYGTVGSSGFGEVLSQPIARGTSVRETEKDARCGRVEEQRR